MLFWRPARRREPDSARPASLALRPHWMDMKLLRFVPVALIAVLVLVAAGCGGGSAKVPSDAVAKVGSDTITKAQFNFLLDGAKRSYQARKTPFPKPGTSQYKQLEDQAVTYLVQQAELEQKAK